MRYLALDIGTKKTGVAFYDDATGIPLPLETITHASKDEFATHVEELARTRMVDKIVCGLPLLPSGEEGMQATIVREYTALLESRGFPCSLFDERYTTPRDERSSDGNASAACMILHSFLSQTHSRVDT